MDGRRDRSGGLEAQRDAVHAVAKPRGGGSVGEDVTEMAAAAAAMHFGPVHAEAGIRPRPHGVRDKRSQTISLGSNNRDSRPCAK